MSFPLTVNFKAITLIALLVSASAFAIPDTPQGALGKSLAYEQSTIPDKIQEYPNNTPNISLEFQYGVPSCIDLRKIIGKPLILDKCYFLFTDPASGERRISGFADVVAVFDVPLDDFVSMMLDFKTHSSFIPYFIESAIMDNQDSSYTVLYKIGLKFLGVEAYYNSIFENLVEQLEGGAVGIRSHLVRSIDGKEFEHFTSYYFAPVTVNGKTMTFIRYFNRPGVRRPTFGMLQVTKIFVPPALEKHVSALGAEAMRRIR